MLEVQEAQDETGNDAYSTNARDGGRVHFLHTVEIVVMRQTAVPLLRKHDKHASSEARSEYDQSELKKLKLQHYFLSFIRGNVKLLERQKC
jgi:hypothetical protein